MKKTIVTLSLLLVLASGGCISSGKPTNSRTDEQQVRRVLDKQVAEWNAGNLPGFMETYARSDSTRFASGGDVFLGWQTVFDRYRRKYGDKETMGALRMSDIDVQNARAGQRASFWAMASKTPGRREFGFIHPGAAQSARRLAYHPRPHVLGVSLSER